MRTLRFRSLLLSAALLTASIAAPRHARANGRFPTAQYVLVGPGTASRTIVLRNTFGLLVSDDSGATFHWFCEDALGYQPNSPYDPPLALDAQGRIHVGLVDGVTRVDADRCTIDAEFPDSMPYVGDMDNGPDGHTVLIATAGPAPTANHVLRSDDSGDHFTALGAGIVGQFFDTVEVAPSNPQRVYVTATQPGSGADHQIFFYRSDDGGATLTQMPPYPTAGLGQAFIAAVDPTNADTVYVRAMLAMPTVDPSTDAAVESTVLLRTRDGGMTWQEIGHTAGAMLGFAISDDGRTVWMGSPDANDRLQRSVDGAPFQRIADTQVLCLRQHAGVLYVCGNDVVDGWALGRSTDGGEHIEPLLRFEDAMGPFTCPADAGENNLCGPLWPGVRAQFPMTEHDAGPGADAGMDAGVAMDATGDAEMHARGGCGCRAAGSEQRARGAGMGGLAVVAASAGFAARRRRTARRRGG